MKLQDIYRCILESRDLYPKIIVDPYALDKRNLGIFIGGPFKQITCRPADVQTALHECIHYINDYRRHEVLSWAKTNANHIKSIARRLHLVGYKEEARGAISYMLAKNDNLLFSAVDEFLAQAASGCLYPINEYLRREYLDECTHLLQVIDKDLFAFFSNFPPELLPHWNPSTKKFE